MLGCINLIVMIKLILCPIYHYHAIQVQIPILCDLRVVYMYNLEHCLVKRLTASYYTRILHVMNTLTYFLHGL